MVSTCRGGARIGSKYVKRDKQDWKCTNEWVIIEQALKITLTKATNIQAGRSIRGLLAPTSWSVQDVRYAFIAPIENNRTMVASGNRQLFGFLGLWTIVFRELWSNTESMRRKRTFRRVVNKPTCRHISKPSKTVELPIIQFHTISP